MSAARQIKCCLVISFLVHSFMLPENTFSRSLVQVKSSQLYRSAKSPALAVRQIVKRNNWSDSLANIVMDTVGTFDVNGLPVFVVNMYDESNLKDEIFFIMYSPDQKGKVLYSRLGTSMTYRTLSFERFNIVTQKKIYLFMYFRESLQNTEDETTVEKVKLFIMAFGEKRMGKFLAYDVPVVISDPQSQKEFSMSAEILDDSLLVIQNKSDSLHNLQKTFLGKYPLKR
jgi:hypothetical protein